MPAAAAKAAAPAAAPLAVRLITDPAARALKYINGDDTLRLIAGGVLAGGLGLAAFFAVRAAEHRPKVSGLVRVTYWGGRGRCEPLRCILAAAGVKFEQRFFDADTGKAELTELRKKGELAYDQVPLVEIDGMKLVQITATANYLGARLGLLPSDPKEAWAAQALFGASQDARGPLVGFPFADYPSAPSAASKVRILAECTGPKGLLGRYAPKWEAMLRARPCVRAARRAGPPPGTPSERSSPCHAPCAPWPRVGAPARPSQQDAALSRASGHALGARRPALLASVVASAP